MGEDEGPPDRLAAQGDHFMPARQFQPPAASSHDISPPRTPGPLGCNDAGDPKVRSLQGDTPSPLGHNDHASPCKPVGAKELKNVHNDADVQVAEVLNLVESYIKEGDSFGFTYAAKMM
jgi:hypothetical protein